MTRFYLRKPGPRKVPFWHTMSLENATYSFEDRPYLTFNATIVAPQLPVDSFPRRNDKTSGERRRWRCTNSRRVPMPFPWITRISRQPRSLLSSKNACSTSSASCGRKVWRSSVPSMGNGCGFSSSADTPMRIGRECLRRQATKSNPKLGHAFDDENGRGRALGGEAVGGAQVFQRGLEL